MYANSICWWKVKDKQTTCICLCIFIAFWKMSFLPNKIIVLDVLEGTQTKMITPTQSHSQASTSYSPIRLNWPSTSTPAEGIPLALPDLTQATRAPVASSATPMDMVAKVRTLATPASTVTTQSTTQSTEFCRCGGKCATCRCPCKKLKRHCTNDCFCRRKCTNKV